MIAFLAVLTCVLIACRVAAARKVTPPDCPNYQCPSGLSLVQTSRAEFVSNGCSTMGGGIVAQSGSMVDGNNEKYAVCCDRWHACYQTCGAAKSTCDAAFKSCYGEMCMSDAKCSRSADLTHVMLNLGGCRMYDLGQNNACECVEKENVEVSRAAALMAFYVNFAPDQAAKTDALAKKADSTTKMAALFRKLHLKYPDSIRVNIEGEVDDHMDDMERMYKEKMQEMREKEARKKHRKEEERKGGSDDIVIEEEDFNDAADDGETEEL